MITSGNTLEAPSEINICFGILKFSNLMYSRGNNLAAPSEINICFGIMSHIVIKECGNRNDSRNKSLRIILFLPEKIFLIVVIIIVIIILK